MTKNYDAIIVGGGLGGLICAARLAKQKRKVLLIEQHYIAGGCATTFKRKEFISEVGLHELDGLDELDFKNRAFEGLEIEKNVQFIKLPEFYRFKSNNTDFVMPDSVPEAIEALVDKFPQEESGIKKFFKLMVDLRTEVSKIPKSNLVNMLLFPLYPVIFPTMVTLTSRASYFSALTNPLFWLFRFKYVFNNTRNVGDYLDKHINDDNLKELLLGNLSYYGDNPYEMSLFYFAISQAGYFQGGGHYIKGGSQNLSNYLVSFIEKHNGEVLLDTLVTEVLIQDEKAVGVEYTTTPHASLSNRDTKKVYSDFVVANGAVPNLTQLLPNKQSSILQNQIKDMKHSVSLSTIYIGFNKDLKEINNHYSTFFSQSNYAMKDNKEQYQGDYENRYFVFVDYSQIDSGLCPEGKSFGAICFIDQASQWSHLSKEEYKNKKQKVIDIFVKKLNEKFPDISDSISFTELGTPLTVQRYTLNPNGSIYGFAQTPSQTSLNRFKIKSAIKNLYFASAWSFPGGGFTGAIICGQQASDAILKFSPNKDLQDLGKLDTKEVKLLEKNNIATNTIELVVQKPKNFKFSSGQYVILRKNNPQNPMSDIYFRPLSIASSPNEPNLRFSMRLSDSGFKQSCDKSKINDSFSVFSPMGDFILPNDTSKKLVFLISGIGITPALSMLKELEHINSKQEVCLFYSSKTEKACAYLKEIKNIKLSNFKHFVVFTSTQSRINEAFLKQNLQNLQEHSYYVVGTSPFISSMKQIIKANKIIDFKIDDFG